MARRTTLMVDDELLRQAREALGTTGLQDTIDAALNDAVGRHLRRRLLDRIRTGDGMDLSPEMLKEVRGQWRTAPPT